MNVVIGGGLGGLSAAHYLLRNQNAGVVLVEASSRVGGWIKSDVVHGHVFESGAHTIRPKGIAGKNTLQLIEELKLDKEITPITSKHPAVKNRMVYVNKHLHKLPSDLLSLFKSVPPFSKPLIAALWNDYRAPARKQEINDESIYSFVQRRFGSEIADYAISPMICGICAGDAKEISVKFLLKDMFEVEQKYGSIVKGMFYDYFGKNKKKNKVTDSELSKRAQKDKWSIYSFKNGLETLPKALLADVTKNGGKVQLNANVTGLEFKKDEVKVTLNDSRNLVAKNVICSLPAKQFANIVKKDHPILYSELTAIPTVTVAVVHLWYDCEVLSQSGFGFLIPPKENIPMLGCIFDSCVFPVNGKTLLTVMLGGKWFQEQFGPSPLKETLYDIAEANTRTILGIKVRPDAYEVSILEDCIPQYIVGHNDRVQRIKDYIKGNNMRITLCGNSYEGVGINDVILSGKNAAQEVIDSKL